MTVKTKKILWIVLFCVGMLFALFCINISIRYLMIQFRILEDTIYPEPNIAFRNKIIAWEIISIVGTVFIAVFSSILFAHKMKVLKTLGQDSPRE